MDLNALKAFVAAGDFSSESLAAAHGSIFPTTGNGNPIKTSPHILDLAPVWPWDEVEQAVLCLLHAAMYRRLGHETQVSRSGHSIVFAPAFRQGRADLSGMIPVALLQLQAAGIDWSSVSMDELLAYHEWHTSNLNQKAVGSAYILITRKFNETYSGSTGAASNFNNVRLVNGLGYLVDNCRIECRSVSAPAGYICEPNYEVIEQTIAEFRQRHPLYREAEVRDNNKAA